MSTCGDIRTALLESDPAALAGEGDSEVAAHVRDCPRCAAAARVILEETAALDGYLAAPAHELDVEAILAEASRPETARVIPFPGWRRWAGLAAAAAIVGLLLFRPDGPVPTPLPRVAQTLPLVEAAPDQNVAVLETANPDITVLWFF